MTKHVHPLYFTPDKPWLAPLAGYSDLSFRLLCREQGAAVACTEMVSAKGLVYGLESRKKTLGGTEALLVTMPKDVPLVVQLFGAEKYFLEKSVQELLERGFAWFDLNMGCSVPKVNKTGAGSAMMKDVANALAVAKAMINAAPAGRVGFKIRLGWSAPDAIYLDVAKALEQLGAGWITLHPRYARQGFSGKADWTALTKLVDALSIPVIASGDLLTAKDAVECAHETGVASVMFARGAINNPAIFRQYIQCMEQRKGEDTVGEPLALNQSSSLSAKEPLKERASIQVQDLSHAELLALILRHAELAKQWVTGKPDKRGIEPALVVMRTTTPRYVKHLPGIRYLRHDLSLCKTWEAFDTVLHNFFSNEGNNEL